MSATNAPTDAIHCNEQSPLQLALTQVSLQPPKATKDVSFEILKEFYNALVIILFNLAIKSAVSPISCPSNSFAWSSKTCAASFTRF